jgi:hypothetical protein
VQADRRAIVLLLVGAAVSVSLGRLWGFTVDDALISCRVAHHLATGAGYRFNVDGPLVDAVTPLGWAHVLVPFARSGAAEALDAARMLGAACVVASALLVAWVVTCRHAAGAPVLVLLAASVPLSAWGVAGMETGVVVLLATLGALDARGAPLAAGAAAAWRPELLPWAITVAVGAAVARGDPRGARVRSGVLALAPFLLVALVRTWLFGSPAPLAVLAKPSDTAHGLFYAAVALLWSGPPALLLSIRLWAGVPRHARVLALATGVHVGALVAAGGDWMPYGRLMAPILPATVLAGAAVAAASPRWIVAARLLLGIAPGAVLLAGSAGTANAVLADRAALAEGLAPLVGGAARIATVDVGWVGVATPAAVVDLAGVTDREVAALPGGHTSKRLPDDFLERRGVDALVLLLAPGAELGAAWEETPFARAVERRIAHQARHLPFSVCGLVEVAPDRPRYLVLGRAPDDHSPEDRAP